MKTRTKLLLLVFTTALFLFVGIREDIDYCVNTSESVKAIKVWGLPISSTQYEGYRGWLEKDLGITMKSDFVDYLDFHPMFPVASTPPGNWGFLQLSKKIYDDDPASRDEIRAILLEISGREDTIHTMSDRDKLDLLRK